MTTCVYCGVSIYNDSDSNPLDPFGPWLETVTTDDLCTAGPEQKHLPERTP